MADPKWKLLEPVWRNAVIRLSNLIGGDFLDSLLSEGILTLEQYDSLLNSLRKMEPKDDVARELLRTLVKTPHPNFDKFWALLDTKIDGGRGLLQQLFNSRDTPSSLSEAAAPQPSSIGVDHRQLEAEGVDVQGHVKIGGGDDQCQEMLLKWPSNAEAAVAAAPQRTYIGVDQRRPEAEGVLAQEQATPNFDTSPAFPDTVAIGGGSDPCHEMLPSSPPAAAEAVGLQPNVTDESCPQLIFIEVVESLKDMYQLHSAAIRAVLKKYLASAYSKNLNDNFLRLEEVFCEELSRVKQREQRMTKARTVAFATEVKPKIRILFPNIDYAKYEPNHDMIKTHLHRVMELRKSELEIEIAKGSITLIISIPGQGLINLLDYLWQNTEPLKILLDVDMSARICFWEFPDVSVSIFSQKDSQRTTVKSAKNVARISPVEKRLPESHRNEAKAADAANEKAIPELVLIFVLDSFKVTYQLHSTIFIAYLQSRLEIAGFENLIFKERSVTSMTILAAESYKISDVELKLRIILPLCTSEEFYALRASVASFIRRSMKLSESDFEILRG